MIRLLIVAEQPALRKGLNMRLAAELDLVVIGEARDCETARSLEVAKCPDVALVDADMKILDGIEVANLLHTL